MKKYHDITVGLHPDLPVWPDSHGIHISNLLTIDEDGWNVSRLDIDVHSGTHIDAPLHILKDGKTTKEFPRCPKQKKPEPVKKPQLKQLPISKPKFSY